MGVDLRLLPFDCDHSDFSFSHTVLSCERRRELWPLIEALHQEPVNPGFWSYCGLVPDGTYQGENCYGVTSETTYGEPLTYTTAGALLTLRRHPAVQDNFQNRAIWAYLAELPLNTKVALYWH